MKEGLEASQLLVALLIRERGLQDDKSLIASSLVGLRADSFGHLDRGRGLSGAGDDGLRLTHGHRVR